MIDQSIPLVLTSCSGAGALVAVAVAMRCRSAAVALRREKAGLIARLRMRDEEMAHLVGTRLPALPRTDAERPDFIPGPLHPELARTSFGRNQQRAMELVGESVEAARLRADMSARTALLYAMRAVQGLSNEQQIAILEMEHLHDDPEVLRGLMGIDHTNAQLNRRAQVVAVLCGSWPGRQRAAASVIDVVRGATSRIRDYRRVEIRSKTEAFIVSRAVEPVVLAMAELLDNAARHSHNSSTVDVDIRPVHNGVVIVVDDAGIGMHNEELQRAIKLLTDPSVLQVTRLGSPPKFGLAVTGVLAARYGFQVQVSTQSPYGGVRAVVFVPSALLTEDPDEGLPPEARAPASAATGEPGTLRPDGPYRAEEVDHAVSPGGPLPGVPVAGGGGALPPDRSTRHPDMPRQGAPLVGSGRHAAPRPGGEVRWSADLLRPPAQQAAAFEPPSGPRSSGGPYGADDVSAGFPLGDLPRRRRRQPKPDVFPTGEPEAAAPAEDRARRAAAAMGALQRGTRSGRAATTPDGGTK